MALRTCDGCGVKLPPFRRRNRDAEGRLLCDGCTEGKPGAPGRPVGFHGSLSCEACAAPMGAAGLVRTGGLLRCADGCKTATVKTAATWFEDNDGEDYSAEWLDVGEAHVQMEMDPTPDQGLQPNGKWSYDAIPYDGRPLTGVADSLEEAKRICEEHVLGGQMMLASKQAGALPCPGCDGSGQNVCITCKGEGTIKPREWTEESQARFDRLFGTGSLQTVAHDSGDGQTIYHCPFCGAGQTVARSDGTTECGFCHTYFTVQVQPEHAAFPQTDPATGQPIAVPGMPGTPEQHQAPTPTPTQTSAPGGTGQFAPAGSGGTEGFAPAGQGPVEQFAPAGSKAASRKVAWSEWGDDPSDEVDPDQEGIIKAWACEFCGTRNQEWSNECRGCNRCETCGEVLPTDPDPRKTYELRLPHRLTHDRYASLQVGAPFAGYKDFDACVAANSDKDDPNAYCATIMRNVEDHKKSSAMYLTPDQVALPEQSYLAHLALRFAEDREAVIQQVRTERASR